MTNWVVENLGWTLLHSLWQIGFVAVVLFSILRILREFSASLRYSISVLALSFSFILPLITFVYLSEATSPIQTEKPITSINSKINDPTKEKNFQVITKNVDVPPTVSVDSPVSSPSLNIPYLTILVVFWFLGIFIFSIRLIGGVWTVHLYRTRQVYAVEAYWQTKFDGLCQNLKINKKVQFLQSKIVEMPVAIGWLKPVVLVSASAFLQISPKELETILVHELVHIKRHDYLVNFLQSLVEILFFYHPCVWWISAKIRAEREFAVDEFISQVFETERIIYANALANLEEIRLTETQAAPILAMSGNGGNLMKRIENILQGNRKLNSKNISIWSAVFAVTFVIGITTGIYWLKTNEIKKSKNGRKVAVVFSDFPANGHNSQSFQNTLELQKTYKIPATWILDSELIKELEQTGKAKELFLEAHGTRSDFIINVPNINYTIFINGDDEYIELWQKRIQNIDAIMSENGDKLRYWTTSATQIPQQMEEHIAKTGLRFTKLPMQDDIRFHFSYEKECGNFENSPKKGMYFCQETPAEKRKEIHEKYLQYISEIFEFNNNYAQEKFGVNIPQVLSLATDDLTNDSANELFQMLQDKGYEFVPLEEVTSNETYKLQETSRDRELFQKKWEILNKYLPRALPASSNIIEIRKKYDENMKKVFKVEVNTKDLKIEGK